MRNYGFWAEVNAGFKPGSSWNIISVESEGAITDIQKKTNVSSACWRLYSFIHTAFDTVNRSIKSRVYESRQNYLSDIETVWIRNWKWQKPKLKNSSTVLEFNVPSQIVEGSENKDYATFDAKNFAEQKCQLELGFANEVKIW